MVFSQLNDFFADREFDLEDITSSLRQALRRGETETSFQKVMCMIFTAFYLDQGQQNTFLRNYFTTTVPASPYKLKMTLDTVASFLKKIQIDDSQDVSIDDDEEEVTYSAGKSPR